MLTRSAMGRVTAHVHAVSVAEQRRWGAALRLCAAMTAITDRSRGARIVAGATVVSAGGELNTVAAAGDRAALARLPRARRERQWDRARPLAASQNPAEEGADRPESAQPAPQPRARHPHRIRRASAPAVAHHSAAFRLAHPPQRENSR